MEAIKRNRIIQWLNIFLLVINVSAFGTILLLNKQAPAKSLDKYNSDEFLKKELNLTSDQYKKILLMDSEVFRIYQSLLDMECASNFRLVEEMTSESPSKMKMDSISINIGKLRAGIKKQTVKHFENIKSICNADQKILLDQLLKEMMELGDQCNFCNKRECTRRDQLNK
jgi:translation initiation factor 2 beta subunit (eIF-2beta)/eIF-5